MTDSKDAALGRLAVYRERRENLHADILAALAAGAIPAEIARASGLSRQWVAKIASREVIGRGRRDEAI